MDNAMIRDIVSCIMQNDDGLQDNSYGPGCETVEEWTTHWLIYFTIDWIGEILHYGTAFLWIVYSHSKDC